jgi:hypothetical protein
MILEVSEIQMFGNNVKKYEHELSILLKHESNTIYKIA